MVTKLCNLVIRYIIKFLLLFLLGIFIKFFFLSIYVNITCRFIRDYAYVIYVDIIFTSVR